MSFGVSNAEPRVLNGHAGGVVGVRIGRRGGRAPVPCHVGGARDVLRDLLRVRDRGVADVMGAQVLAPRLVDAMHATIDNWR